MFVRRAGTLILASMIVIWALLYFPSTDAQGRPFAQRLAELDAARSLDDLSRLRSVGLHKLRATDAEAGR